ncbi:hypothetical protein CBL_20807 [Carabus blaptoides fortunei]
MDEEEQKAVQKGPPGRMGSRPRVFRPFQLISTDIVGPLARSSKGYKYILVVADYYSKFVLTYPMRSATAQAVSKHIEDDVFLLFGVPQYLICDNGVQFRRQTVWRRYFALSNVADNFASKLAPKYVGPFVIRKKISSTTYELGDHNGKERGVWHVKDLKPGSDEHDNDNN